MFILQQRSPIGAGDEPFKKGSRHNLWEKKRLCKQIKNPYRHSSEVKLCQLAVMASSLVKRNGSTSSTHTHTHPHSHTLWFLFEVSHYSQTKGLTGDIGQQRWDSQWPSGPMVSLQEGQLSQADILTSAPPALERSEKAHNTGQKSEITNTWPNFFLPN